MSSGGDAALLAAEELIADGLDVARTCRARAVELGAERGEIGGGRTCRPEGTAEAEA